MYGEPNYDDDGDPQARQRVWLISVAVLIGALLLGAAYPKAGAALVGVLSWLVFTCTGTLIGG